MKRLISLVLCSVCVLSHNLAQAQDRSNGDAAILGNQELPKVLYIVPWKKPVQGEVASSKGFVSVVNEELVPIDREVFRRQLQFQSQLQARQQPKTTDASVKPVAP